MKGRLAYEIRVSSAQRSAQSSDGSPVPPAQEVIDLLDVVRIIELAHQREVKVEVVPCGIVRSKGAPIAD